MKYFVSVILFCHTLVGCQREKNDASSVNTDELLVRIAELEIYPEYIDEYISILQIEAAASVEVESGVISIFPMTIKDDKNKVRIIEIYADQAAYKSHLKTPHFLLYKTSTAEMVKDLKLIDMTAIDPSGMSSIFKKLN
ncbi:putative quinol monooxygenase [Jiulongibacter sp. NS-SX5]|uniref:putative quinol monooxygenase n=1 Tax=Jiulongibacter sp. NS-SX5 TaxID=3463854 RepID=UPI004059026E